MAGTVEILKKINEKERCRYTDLTFIVSYSTLNTRLLQLTDFGLVRHHIKRNGGKREEWYGVTEMGKKVLKALEQFDRIFKG